MVRSGGGGSPAPVDYVTSGRFTYIVRVPCMYSTAALEFLLYSITAPMGINKLISFKN